MLDFLALTITQLFYRSTSHLQTSFYKYNATFIVSVGLPRVSIYPKSGEGPRNFVSMHIIELR
jgi:hypothetical protein